MASAIETSLVKFQSDFAANYGSSPGALPSWLSAFISAIMAALPGILAGCGINPTPAGVKTGIADNPLGTDLKLRALSREAGVPIMERGRASQSAIATANGTADADMANILSFSQAA